MATFHSVEQYRKVMQSRIKALKQSGDKSALAAASHQVMDSRRMAPAATGTLRMNIRKRKMAQGRWMAESWVPGTFKYNKWVNQSPGFETLNYPIGAVIPAGKSITGRSMQVIPPGGIAVYGRTPNWRWTGTPGYWSKAIASTRKYFHRIAKESVRKSMRVTT